jgi:hypothetical protein
VAGDTNVATQTIYFDNTHASYLELPVADSTVSVSELSEPKEAALEVYPNPASDVAYVMGRGNSLSKIEMYDVSGKKVFASQNVQAVTRIDLTDFTAGIYLVKAYSEKEISHCKIAVIKR